jgi:hypothetical protein
MSNFSEGVPDFEKNVSVDSVGETPSIVEASSGSCSFDIWKTSTVTRTGAKNEVSLVQCSVSRRGAKQRPPV